MSKPVKTCGTCKHFGPEKYFDYWDDAADDTVEVKKFHVCQFLQHLNDCTADRKAMSTAIAGVTDGSGYHAAFCVSEDFGCNQWKQIK